MKQQPHERRHQPRHRVTPDVLVSPLNQEGDYLKTRLCDLSLGGASIEAPAESLATEQQVLLCLVNQPGDCFPQQSIHARVVYNDGDTVGLAFDSVGVDVMRAIRALLKDAKYF